MNVCCGANSKPKLPVEVGDMVGTAEKGTVEVVDGQLPAILVREGDWAMLLATTRRLGERAWKSAMKTCEV